MGDKEFFENDKTLQSILNNNEDFIRLEQEELYREITSKPLMTGQDLLDLPYEPNDYLIEKFLWKNDIAFIIASEKAGKSIFTSQMAFAMTCGRPFLDCFDVARPLNVLYVQAEGSLSETHDRIQSSTSDGGCSWDPQRWRHFYPPALALDTEAGYEDFVGRIRSSGFNPDVIIIDPLYMAMSGGLSDETQSRKFCRNIRQIKEDFDCSFIVVHHQHRDKTDSFGRKINEGDNAIMGSFVWKAFPSHILHIENNKKTKLRRLTCQTQRSSEVLEEMELRLEGKEENKPLKFVSTDEKPTESTVDKVYNFIKFNKETSVKDLCDTGGYKSQKYLYEVFTKLRDQKRIKISRKKGNRVYYKPI